MNIQTTRQQTTSNPTPQQSLRDLFMSGTHKGRLLAQPTPYRVNILSAECVTSASTEKNPEGAEFIRITYAFPTLNNRIEQENRFFVGFNVFLSQIKKQLNIENNDVNVQEFLAMLITQKVDLNLWVSYQTQNNTEYRNFNFLPPLQQNSNSQLNEAAAPTTEDF